MPRSETGISTLLFACETESLVDITTRGAEVFHFTTARDGLNLSGTSYTNHLLRVGELKESGGQETNRVNVRVSNETEAWGIRIASQLRTLALAKVEIRRFFSEINNRASYQTKNFFTGKLINAETVSEVTQRDSAGRATVIEKYISFDVIPKSTASGLSVALRTLSPSCAFVFKDIHCQYSGGETVCNKQLKSKEGCRGRNNTSHNGGWTFPETPTQGLPSTSGGGGGIGGGTCFVKGTRIFTPKGWRKIEQMKKGFSVYSFNESTLEVERDFVVNPFRHIVSGYFEFRFSDGSRIKVTGEHRFLRSNGEWIRADEFSEDTEIWKHLRGWQKVKVTAMKYVSEITEVYNIHVAKNHTYFAEGFAVHNAKEPEII